MSIQKLRYAFLLDEYRKELNPKEKEKLKRLIRKDSKVLLDDLLNAIEESIDKINKTK